MKSLILKKMRELGIRFNLKQMRDADKLTQIMMAINVGRKRVRIYTHLRVKPRQWSKHLYRCVYSPYQSERERMQLDSVNEQLDALVLSLYEADRRKADMGRYLDEETIREVVEDLKQGKKADRSPIIMLREMIEGYEHEINRRGRKGVSTSRRVYDSAISRLENYDRKRAHPIESFEEFNSAFFEDFQLFLYSYTYGKKQLHYTRNTIINTLKVIKNLLHRAYDRRLLRDDSFKRVQTVLPASVSDQIYLKPDELQRFAKVTTLNQEEREVRDMFIIACYTALRFSDIQQLGHATFEDEVIKLYQQKTKEVAMAPITNEIMPLLKYYRQVGFPTLRRSHVTEILRNLATRCHIDEPFTQREERGGEVIFNTEPKYQFISFHTARRSCITNLYLQGYTTTFIMSISGHRSVNSLMRYVKASGQEVLNRLIEQFKERKVM